VSASKAVAPDAMLKNAIPLNRSTFTHGLVPCPECGLPLDAAKDVDELLGEGTDPKVRGAQGAHRRCGASFQVRLED
jgi:hypothetical protein